MAGTPYDNHTLAVIGAIIVCWAGIEKQVAGAVHWIESGYALNNKLPNPKYTDLSKFRSLKERKGHLRKLVETYGTPDELNVLDEIYRVLVKPNRIRHTLCHDLIHPAPNGDIYITKIGNFAKGEAPDVSWTSVANLERALKVIRPISTEIYAIGKGIHRRLYPNSK